MLSLISVHHCAKVDNSYHLVSFMIETDINVWWDKNQISRIKPMQNNF